MVIGRAEDEPPYWHYLRLLDGGTKPNLAKLTIASPRRARQLQHRQDDGERILIDSAPGQPDLLTHAHPCWPKKLFESAISTSFCPISRLSSLIRRS